MGAAPGAATGCVLAGAAVFGAGAGGGGGGGGGGGVGAIGGGSGSDRGGGAPAPSEPAPPAAQPAETPVAGGVLGAETATKRFVRGKGALALRRAIFQVDLSKGARGKVVLVDRRTKRRFHTLSVSRVSFTARAATIRGTGLLNGRRVAFTAVLTDNGAAVRDVFVLRAGTLRVSSKLVSGNITVR